MFRLHVDVPLGMDKESAIELGNKISMAMIEGMALSKHTPTNFKMGYCVFEDTDRKKRNYLKLDENNHASSSKNYVEF